MTKNILLATAALGVIALAGTAQASTITSAKVSNIALGVTAGVVGGTTTTVYTVANESVFSTLGNRTTTVTPANNTISVLSGAAFAPGTTSTSYAATYTLTGATFSSAVQPSQIGFAQNGAANTGSCTPTANVVAGGGAGQTSVTVVFTIAAATCGSTGVNMVDTVTFDMPFTMDQTASTVSVSAGFTVTSTAAVYGGANAAGSLVQKAVNWSAAVSPLPTSAATGLPTSLSLSSAPVYSALVVSAGNNDTIIGSVRAALAAAPTNAALVTLTPTIFGNLAAASRGTLTYDLVIATNGGQFTSVIPRLATDDTLGTLVTNPAPNGTNTSFTYTGLSVPYTIAVQATGTTATAAQATTGSATFFSSTAVVAAPAASVINLETVTLQGTNFIAPWVGNVGAASTSVIRVGNSGAQTGPVTLTILSPVTASSGVVTNASVTRAVCTSATLPKLANIGANSELQLTSADFATCFGTTFTRADIRVSVQAVAVNLSAKMRITSSASTTEQSLGAISADVATTN
ncbi:hypothetical protein [Brevundimonas sp. TWP2-3-4b1]|uniref:hypothetical protein n=1 Tax=Brevundimonas sp. TWP2-3-4b1 TaxID=2804580 RepID=UPI003CE76F70